MTIVSLTLKARIIVIAFAALLGGAAEAKNMFYLLHAKWCDLGGDSPVRFEITEDGSLVYEPGQGRACQISSATNMDSPMGDYNVTWRCEGNRQIKEKLSTYVEADGQGNRRFMLRREKMTRSGRPEIFEQCKGQG